MINMTVHLDPDIFEVVKNETKTIEVRVNDEKRRRLKVGDKIAFLKRPDELEQIEAIVEELIYYKDFNDLVKDYTIEEMYLKGYTKEYFLNLLKRFYSDEEIEEYGTVAIRFKKIEG